VAQNEAHDDIEIVAAPEEHRKTYQEAMEADNKPEEQPAAEEVVAESSDEIPAEDDGTSSIVDEVGEGRTHGEDEQEQA
jgi:hypothetical protein